jgi:hypothetical protein
MSEQPTPDRFEEIHKGDPNEYQPYRDLRDYYAPRSLPRR